MPSGWAVEVTVFDDRAGMAPGTYWLKADAVAGIYGTAYAASRGQGGKAPAWSPAQARAVARRAVSLMARFAREEPGQDVAVRRDPEEEGDLDTWGLLEERGSIGQDVEYLAVAQARRVPYATARHATAPGLLENAPAAASEPYAVAAMEAS